MRRAWIVLLIVAALLVGGFAVASSPLFNKDEAPDTASASVLLFNVTYENGQLVFTVTNPTETTANLEFMTSEHYRLVVVQGDQTVFDSSEGMMFTQQINDRELEAGGQLTYQVDWTPPGHGAYEVQAYFMAVSRDDPVATTTLTFH